MNSTLAGVFLPKLGSWKGEHALFFVGIFGVQPGRRQVGEGTGICPACEAFDRYEVEETYTYLHFFFIPIWKWNKRYYVRTRCCGRRMALDEAIGARIAQGERIQLRPEHITAREPELQEQVCRECGSPLRQDYRFCPHCGTRR
mgnify:CR=1 FL=1|jgi:hypothetical protein